MSKQVRPAGAFQNSPIVQHGQRDTERLHSTGHKNRGESPIPYRLVGPGLALTRVSVATGHVFDDDPDGEVSVGGAVVPDAERDVPLVWGQWRCA